MRINMAPVLPWVCIVFVVFRGTMGHASPHVDLGLFIHPVSSSPVYTVKDLQISEYLQEEEQELGQSQPAACKILNTTESGPGLHEVKTLPRKSFSFFVKPESSFKKLVIKLSLQNAISISDDFYSDEDITLNTEDLTHSGSNQWTHVRVEHYQHERRLRLDRHAFKVSFANTTLSRRTHDAWVWKGFKGFTVFAEGGANVLFNCAPGDLDKTQVADYVLYSIWLLAGLMIVATFLLAALCFVYVYLKYQRKKKRASVSPMKYPVYDEFGEEVLERFRQKVEDLRRGKSLADSDTVIVSYPPRQENFYVLEETRCGGVEEISPEEHHYEDIEKNYKHLHATDNVYQNLANANDDGRNVSTVDNIYESLSCFENYLEKRKDEARTSSRYMTS